MTSRGGDPKHSPVAISLSLLLWIALIGGFVAVSQHAFDSKRSSPAVGPSPAGTFNHIYPSDPFPFERPPVGTSSPYVDSTGRIHTGARATSMAELANVAPQGAFIQQSSHTWLLTRPVELGVGSSVTLHGPLTINVAPRAFLLAQHGAVLRLTDVTMRSVTAKGALQSSAVATRGFIDARSGAVLQLEHDTFIDLGYLGDQTYGITIDGGSSKSYLRHCSVTGDFFGVYLGRVDGVAVTSSRFVNSVIYGIDPHTYDSHLTITDNTVIGSGVHGIVVADHVIHSLIARNHVINSRDHGIVLFQFADDNTIIDNTINGNFDGIVVTDSSRNHISANHIGPSARFAIRIGGISSGNSLSHNVISHALVGMYIYQGASFNTASNNSFSAAYENIRIRSDAPHNVVTPNPGRSEL
jgi:parallel beta-helix repeat protein